MSIVNVVTLLVTKSDGFNAEIVSLDVCDPMYIDDIIRDGLKGLEFLNAWKDGREEVLAYRNGAGEIYHFKTIKHSVFLND